MRSLNRIVLILLVVFMGGCSTIPFNSTHYTPIGDISSQDIIKRFDEVWPINFYMVNSVQFNYHGQVMTGIGYISANREKETFTVVCMNPVGVKLFEIVGDKDTANPNFVMEDMAKMGDLAQAVASDIRRSYFNCIPRDDAQVVKDRTKITFTQSEENGTLEYVFAGKDLALVEKSYYESKKKLWSVFYYEYAFENGKLYPGGIVYRHYKYNYKLVVKLKEVKG